MTIHPDDAVRGLAPINPVVPTMPPLPRAGTKVEVRHRRGVWEVTRDGEFHGHYGARLPAFVEAERVARAAVAGGDSAVIRLHEERPATPPSGQSKPARLPNGELVMVRNVRTITFRAATAQSRR